MASVVVEFSTKFSIQVERDDAEGRWMARAYDAATCADGRKASFMGQGRSVYEAVFNLADALRSGYINGVG